MMALALWSSLGGCAQLRTEPAPSQSDTVWPHAEGFKEATAHGPEARAPGARCTSCHGEALPGPACSECHELYPHPSDWLEGTRHGEGLFGEGADASVCESCHATPGLAASESYGCTQCHASYPHPDGWETQESHGAYALARGSAEVACGSCHGADLSGGDVGVGCSSCHSVYPHASDWGEGHRAAYQADPQLCATCHGEGEPVVWTGGQSKVGCSACHAVYPHPDAELWHTGHISAATTTGERVCAACHDPSEGPATMAVSCADRCHGGQP